MPDVGAAVENDIAGLNGLGAVSILIDYLLCNEDRQRPATSGRYPVRTGRCLPKLVPGGIFFQQARVFTNALDGFAEFDTQSAACPNVLDRAKLVAARQRKQPGARLREEPNANGKEEDRQLRGNQSSE